MRLEGWIKIAATERHIKQELQRVAYAWGVDSESLLCEWEKSKMGGRQIIDLPKKKQSGSVTFVPDGKNFYLYNWAQGKFHQCVHYTPYKPFASPGGMSIAREVTVKLFASSPTALC